MQQKSSETTEEGAYQKRDDLAAGRCYSGGGPIVLYRLKERLKAFKILKLFRSPVVPLFIWQVRHFIWQVRQIWSKTQMFTTDKSGRGPKCSLQAAIESPSFRAFAIFNSMALSASLASLTILVFWQSWYLALTRHNMKRAGKNLSHPLLVSLGIGSQITRSEPFVTLAVWLLKGSIVSVLAAGTAACFVLQQNSSWAEAAGVVLVLIGPVLALAGSLWIYTYQCIRTSR